MFLYKGGQTVKKGTYWESEKNAKIVLDAGGVLPGGTKELYFRLPESYALIPIVLVGIGLSMAFPYGAGFLLFVTLIALCAALYAAGTATTRLLKEVLGKNATFGYSPTTAYMAGKKTKKRGKDEETGDTGEEK
jgi:hypothetical protein